MFKSVLSVAMVLSIGVFSGKASAYDTQGRFGMGIKLWGTPLVLFSNMKIGITNALGVEPSIGYHQFKLKNTYTTYSEYYDSYYGEYVYDEVDAEQELKFSLLYLSTIFDIKPIRTDKSNLVLRAGVGYWRAMMSSEEEDMDGYGDFKAEDSFWSLSINSGLGVEHFFTDHFSVYAGFLVAWYKFGGEDIDADISFMTLGNQFSEFSLTWYL